MADTLTGVTEIDAASLADISSVTQMYLQQASMLLPTVTDYGCTWFYVFFNYLYQSVCCSVFNTG